MHVLTGIWGLSLTIVVILIAVKKKWMVYGEVYIRLFAIRDIKKGDELTFDYNYLRVLELLPINVSVVYLSVRDI